MSMVADGQVRPVVPAYFHPAVCPGAWELLAQCAPVVRLVVLNLANGPGAHPDETFLAPLARLRDAGVAVAGYVDTNYGQRPTDDALADFERYRDWYGVTGVLFDRTSSIAEHVDHYAALAQWVRVFGADLVAFNHGAHPVESYAEHADLLGTFEGPWRAYVEASVPRWVRSRPADQFFHLVYSVPRPRVGDAYAIAARRHAEASYITDHGGDNPWECLPAGRFDCLATQ